MDTSITPLSDHDLPELALLYRQFWNEDSDVNAMRTVFSRLRSDPNYILLAAHRDNVLAGSAMGIICEELYGACRPFMVVEDVVVGAQYRRKGIGTALMRELERIALERGCASVLFVSEAGRADACAFYRSLGYDPDTKRGFKKRLAR